MELLIYHRLLSQDSVARLTRFAEEHSMPPPRFLPDDSALLEFRDLQSFDSWAPELSAALVAQVRASGLHTFPFSHETGCVWLDWEYMETIGEPGFAMATSRPKGWIVPDLALLRFGVLSRRGAMAKIERTLPDYLGNWLARATVAGAAGEGPVVCRSPSLVCWDKRADIELDWTRSGPRTLMWLAMEMLEYGHRFAPVYGIALEPDEEAYLDYVNGLLPEPGYSVEQLRDRYMGQMRGRYRKTVGISIGR